MTEHRSAGARLATLIGRTDRPPMSDRRVIREDSRAAGQRAREFEQAQRDAGNGVPPNHTSGVSNDSRVQGRETDRRSRP